MIKIENGPAFVVTSADTQSARKVQELVIDYKTSLVNIPANGEEPAKKVGMIGSFVYDETGSNIMGVQKSQPLDPFAGKDILAELHVQYIAELKALNPTLKFVNTLIVA